MMTLTEAFQELNKLYEAKEEKLYHVSEKKLIHTMHPEVPKSDHEEQKTPRICFAKTIQGCLIGAFEDKDLTGKVLHVYSTVSDYYQPTEKEVADVEATGEVWIMHDVEPKYEYDIKITGKDGSKTYNFDGNDFEVPTWKYEKIIKEAKENIKQTNIYITGVQGSGKTTYAEKLSKELDLPVVHLDDVDNIFFDDEVKESDPLIAEFFNSIDPEILKGTQADFKKYGISNGKKIHKFFKDLLRFLEDSGPVIVEGLQILDLLDVIDTTKNKVILIDKPFDKTITQLYKREKNNIKAGNFRINDRAVKDFDDLKASMDYSWADDAIKQLRADKNVEVITESMTYDPPYNAEQIKANYGEETYNKLINDPAHKWRMETGIELIHREPSLKELNRIWANWQLMTDEQKAKSDEKCKELFGCTNEENYKKLVPLYKE